LKAGERGTRPVTAGGHEWARFDPRAYGWAPPVIDLAKKKKRRGTVGLAGERAGPCGPTARACAEKGGRRLALLWAEKKKRKKMK
jgi:hypothetical protein